MVARQTMEDRVLGDKYEFIKLIDIGGQAVVELACDRRLKRMVAIKRSNLNVLDETNQERLLREAYELARLSHPHIVPIYDLVEHHQQLYIVMQYANGGDLDDQVKRSASGLSLVEVVDIGIAMCDALEILHRKGIIHRDVKPSNVLLFVDEDTQESTPLLADLGVAYSMASVPITTDGKVYGTIQFLPPEAILGREGTVDPRRDVYGLGAVLYYALTKQYPHGAGLEGLSEEALVSAPKPPQEYRREVPDWLAQIVLRAIDPDRDNRYPTMRMMQRDLLAGRQLLEGESLVKVGLLQAKTQPLRSSARPPLPVSRRGWLLAIALVAALVLLAATLRTSSLWPFAFWPRDRPTPAATMGASPTATPSPSPTARRSQALSGTLVPRPSPTATSTWTATVTATPTATSTPTVAQTETSTTAPTSTPRTTMVPLPSPTAAQLAAPALLAPTPGTTFVGWNAEVVLAWSGVGLLQQDEYYVVRIPYDRAGNVAEFWRRDTTFRVPSHFSTSEVGFLDRHYSWSVQVMECTESCDRVLDDGVRKRGEERSLPSEEWVFYWHPDITGDSTPVAEPTPTRALP